MPTTIATQLHVTPAQVASAWLLAQKPWTVPVPGTRKLSRLDEDLGGANLELADTTLQRIGEAAARIVVQGERYSDGSQRMIER